ncbi:methyltransferase domain-containing protein [Embleya hyalina]|uniref:Protein-L-isoaspartate O-methyltransferase n=1 Tax=Embleya hyalina TaxID=516124 RepID=A0A401YXC7_9ACTN|nr:methyltransferase domain-containing protein [Embleya hyalina]GCD99266.1 protein-L-isoaspartate O-methyltransferase [Embleya hyalina]
MRDDAEIVGALDREGAFPAPWVREAMLAVPRAAFAPDVVWHPDPATGHYTAVDRHADPDAWDEVVLRPEPVVTQVDDGTTDSVGDLASSSLSDYRAVASFLTELDVHPGQRVLEIGTGPGWTAALLAWRLGGENIVSVEIDAALAAGARAAHARVGLSPTVITGDGTLGAPDAGTFDRVHATAAFTHRVPYAWIEQTRPGAVIVAPWSPGFGAGALLRLVSGDDGTASGKLVRSVAFMELRGERDGAGAAFEAAREAEPATGESEVEWVLDSLYRDGNFTHAVALRVPDVRLETLGAGTVWRLWDRQGSWALVDDRPGVGKAVQGGPRRLWDEVDTALAWQDEHRIHGYDFGITVEPDHQWAWAERPDRRWEM